MPSLSTRLKARWLKTFRGRSQQEAGWEESSWVSSPPQTFKLGRLVIEVAPRGVKSAGHNPPSAVYEVRVGIHGDARAWSSRYGLPAADNSALAAAETALNDLDQAWREPKAWKARATEGMTPDEVEAIEDSPAMRLDLEAARWIGPELDAVRATSGAGSGGWLGG